MNAMLAICKKVLFAINNRIDKFRNYVLIRYNQVGFGKGVLWEGIIHIRNDGKIVVGDNARINSGAYHNPVGGYRKTALITEKSGYIQIGNHCGIPYCILWKR